MSAADKGSKLERGALAEENNHTHSASTPSPSGGANSYPILPCRFPNVNLGPQMPLSRTRTYNDAMARGWESKSVEAQQQDASDQSAKGPNLTPEAAALSRQKETLRLARQNILKQLEVAEEELHRKLLQDSLAALEQKLARIED